LGQVSLTSQLTYGYDWMRWLLLCLLQPRFLLCFRPYSVAIEPNTPLINRGEESLPKLFANSTASLMATLIGVLLENRISNIARRRIFLSTIDICSTGKA